MRYRVILVILVISLVVNTCLGIVLLEERLHGPVLLPEISAIPSGAGNVSRENREIVYPPAPLYDRVIDTNRTRMVSSLQGPAVMTMVSYTRRGLYQETSETGTTMNISVEIEPGAGRVLVQTTPLMGIFFQDAANTAVQVARNQTGFDPGGYDIIFSISSGEVIPEVDGPSAGALMTLITEAAITGRPLRDNVTLTGTIKPDGTVGAIGGIVEKAKAAKAAGKDLLLLPRENENLAVLTEDTRNLGAFQYVVEVREDTPAKEYLETNVGIRVEYVSSIDDIKQYLYRSG